MTQPGETDGYSLEDHMEALTKHNVPCDIVISAQEEIPPLLVEKYLTQHSICVKTNQESHPYQIVKRPLLRFDNQLVRHDSLKVKEVILELLERV